MRAKWWWWQVLKLTMDATERQPGAAGRAEVQLVGSGQVEVARSTKCCQRADNYL